MKHSANIALICRSRGRPDEARAMMGSALSSSEWNVRAFFLVDVDDPQLDKYPEGDKIVLDPPAVSDTDAVKRGLRAIVSAYGEYDIYGYIPDTVRFENLGWDEEVRHKVEHLHLYPDVSINYWFADKELVKKRGLFPRPKGLHEQAAAT